MVGILPGTDPDLHGEAVVIGAHFDHLGRKDGILHPGADDNASGVAALLRVAEILQAGPGLGRSVIFAAFTGEESMMLGSNHYVAHPPVPLERTRGMLNLDMVGRLRDQPLVISGTETAPFWPLVLRTVGREAVPWEIHPEVRNGSDHLPFHRKDVPVLYLTTGRHADSHRPSDTWSRVDAEGVEQVAQVVARIVRDLATQ